jgi:transposase
MHYVYGIEDFVISKFARCSTKTLRRWYKLFEETGNVAPSNTRERPALWPCEAVEWTRQYVLDNPCFYIKELQSDIKEKFKDLVENGEMKLSVSTVFRVLRFDLELSRKILTKREREASQEEVDNFYVKLKKFYKRNDQLVFVDKTSKDSRDAIRNYAWSRRGTPSVVKNKFGRSIQSSILAAVDGTYNRTKFHSAFVSKILPEMNPYPFPRSIIILDNAKIHTSSFSLKFSFSTIFYYV